ncbi:hypothetical protein FPSE_06341 [Fusarium pseudograminearum CS3096]|uniref:Uncharacterized protein n=1 Tax=Fusarium pseudograminearum (strain CS3096) TaxID=1028729 RepID=K3VH45_FUSPC|nr:hypothetical protein FPSE_06341 [Fusarium pseudograminearum CS3096]EKJ73479.1 hypothetical protein FPSE_06341 [Fusarium pseudograminearum CS3096]
MQLYIIYIIINRPDLLPCGLTVRCNRYSIVIKKVGLSLSLTDKKCYLE